MKRYVASFAVMLSLVLSAGQAQEKKGKGGFGKGGFGKGGFGGGFGSPTAFYENKDVQKDLKMDTKQVAKIEELAKRYKDATGELKGKEAFTKVREVRTEVQKELDSVVTEAQKNRVKQLQLQQRGAGALVSETNKKELGLSDDQVSKIQEVLKTSREKQSELSKGFKDDQEGTRKKLAELRKETLANAVKVLTPEQQKSWAQMTGPAFEGTLPAAGGLGGGFGGGGGFPKKDAPRKDAPKKGAKIL